MDAVQLLHAGHAKNVAEVLLTVFGFVVTLAGLAVAVFAMAPRPKRGSGGRRSRGQRAGPPSG